jgi:hypothetical protein
VNGVLARQGTNRPPDQHDDPADPGENEGGQDCQHGERRRSLKSAAEVGFWYGSVRGLRAFVFCGDVYSFGGQRRRKALLSLESPVLNLTYRHVDPYDRLQRLWKRRSLRGPELARPPVRVPLSTAQCSKSWTVVSG